MMELVMDDVETESVGALEESVRAGLHKCHQMDVAQARYTHENAVELLALKDLLISKGLLNQQELDEQMVEAEQVVGERRSRAYVGPILYPRAEEDAAPALIDCDTRYRQCGGACCRLYDVYLTDEEVRSGRYRWDLARPYRLERRDDGSCSYLDLSTMKCTIWSERPTVCRGYTCHSDDNIWVDFDKRIGTGAMRHKVMAEKR